MAKPVPEGTPSLVPHLVVKDGARAIDFYKVAFGVTELRRSVGPDGKSIMHAELQLGDSRIYIAEETAGMGQRSPLSLEGSPVTLHLWSEDVDAAVEGAKEAGAAVVMPAQDMFWGDRYGQVKDPFGHLWAIATHKEDLPPAEIAKRAEASFAAMAPPSRAAKPKARSKVKTATKKRPKKAAARKRR